MIQGIDVFETISNRPTDTNDYPVERVILRKVTILPREQLPAPPVPGKPGAAAPAKPSLWRRIWPW